MEQSGEIAHVQRDGACGFVAHREGPGRAASAGAEWRRIARRQAIGMAISYGGVLLVFGHEVKLDGSGVALGALLVFLSAVSYAVYLFYSGELVQRLGSLRLVGLATSVACVLCIGQFVALRPLARGRRSGAS